MFKSLKDFFVKMVSVVDFGDNPGADILLFKADPTDILDKAVWTTAYMNDLPDSAFLYIEPGGTKTNGKTQGNKRHFPYKNAEGAIDRPHLTNAIARIPQANVPQDVKDRCQARARRLLAGLNKSKEGGVNMTLEELYKELSEDQVKLIKKEIEDRDLTVTNLEKDKKELEKNQKEPVKKVEPTDEELIKSANPKIQALLEKAQKDANDAKEEAGKLKKEKDEKDAELKKAVLVKEAEQFENIGATKEDLIEIFTKIDKTGDNELMEKVKAILSADNTALKDNPLTKSKGSDKDVEDKKAMEKVKEKAEELIKSDSKLTKEQAEAKALKENPELYTEYTKE